MLDAMVESGGEPAPSWTSGVDGHGTVLAFSWLPWPLDEIKSRRDGPRTGNRHFILKKVKFYSRSRKKVTVLNLFYKGAVNAYFLTGSFFKKTVVFEAAIFVGQPEDGAEVRCEVSRRVEPAVSRYSGPSALRFLRCSARTAVALSDLETERDDNSNIQDSRFPVIYRYLYLFILPLCLSVLRKGGVEPHSFMTTTLPPQQYG